MKGLVIALSLAVVTARCSSGQTAKAATSHPTSQPSILELIAAESQSKADYAETVASSMNAFMASDKAKSLQKEIADAISDKKAIDADGTPEQKLEAASRISKAKKVFESEKASASKSTAIQDAANRASAAASALAHARAEAKTNAELQEIRRREETSKPPKPFETTVNIKDLSIELKPSFSKPNIISSIENKTVPTSQRYVVIRVKVWNESETLKYRWPDPKSFSETDHARLSDELGNNYARIEPPIGEKFDHQPDQSESIYPKTALYDVFVFELPVSKASSLTLSLPELGSSERKSVVIPRQKITSD